MVGDKVQIAPGAFYLNSNKEVPTNILNLKLYIRNVKEKYCTVAKSKTGSILGDIANENLKLILDENDCNIDSYIVSVNKEIPLYRNPSEKSSILRNIKRFNLITIVDEKDGFGKIKKGAGWLKLADVEKL